MVAILPFPLDKGDAFEKTSRAVSTGNAGITRATTGSVLRVILVR